MHKTGVMSSYLKFLILSLHLGEKHIGKDFFKKYTSCKG